MKPRLAITFLLIVLMPVALLSWLGGRLIEAENRELKRRFQEVYARNLAELDQAIHRLVEERERDLLRLTDQVPASPDALRQLSRTEPTVDQMFLLARDGAIVFPNPDDSLSAAEWEFLRRARQVLTARLPAQAGSAQEGPTHTTMLAAAEPPQRPSSFLDSGSGKATLRLAKERPQTTEARRRVAKTPAPESTKGDADDADRHPVSADAAPLSAPKISTESSRQEVLESDRGRASSSARQQAPAARPIPGDHGWYVWFWDEGIHMIFWRLDESGRIVGAELDRVRFLSDVIGLLPETPAGPGDGDSRLVLSDGLGRALYQWGAYEPSPSEQPVAERSLRHPLGAWALRQFVPAASMASFGRRGLLVNLAGAASLATLAFIALAVYFYRESTRELREAAQRVTFVNQVSHELKTPLTNIRMYAELLDDSLDADDKASRGRLGVIVSESARLSRLIGNILSFSRSRRNKLTVRPAPGDVDTIVRNVAASFAPALQDAGIETQLRLGAPGRVMVDADALEQILGNLLGNVEKYAAQGQWVGIETSRQGDTTRIAVEDRGPGVSPVMRERIFLPFQRGSDRICEGVAGTGIGLAIARELARLHRGDLRLAQGETGGARFEILLHTEPAQEGETR